MAERVGKVEGVPVGEHRLKASEIVCLAYLRREVPKTLRNLIFIGVAPAVGAVLLSYVFVRALFNFSDPANSYGNTGQEWLEAAPTISGGAL